MTNIPLFFVNAGLFLIVNISPYQGATCNLRNALFLNAEKYLNLYVGNLYLMIGKSAYLIVRKSLYINEVKCGRVSVPERGERWRQSEAE
jgi:hypothetical protein